MQNIKFYCIASWIEEGTRAIDSGCSKVNLALEFQTMNTKNNTKLCQIRSNTKSHWHCSDKAQLLLAHNQSFKLKNFKCAFLIS